MIEVLLSVMNLKNEDEQKKLLHDNGIKGNCVVVNQVKNQNDVFSVLNKKNRLYSFNEKGASVSRNRLIELAKGDICVFADDDMKYVENYEEIITQEYKKNKDAEIILFYVENINQNREKSKKIGDKRIGKLDIMKARTPEITFKRKELQKHGVKFDEDFGPNAIFPKGEETVFLSDCLNKGIKIYSINKKIGSVEYKESTWFTGFNKHFLNAQGAIFARIAPKAYKIYIIQYVLRKHNLYKKNVNLLEAYKEMLKGAKKYRNAKK